MEVATDPPTLHALDCSRYSAEDPHFVTSKVKFSILDIYHFQAEFLDEVVV